MEIYLIRHTTPDIARGVCYGQSDIDVTASFEAEAAAIGQYLPATIGAVYSSPLQRCSKLAARLFPSHEAVYSDALKEIDCGDWELLEWDAIPPVDLQPWMEDFVTRRLPNGENYVDLYNRCTAFFEAIPRQTSPIAIVSHGGVLRSLLSHITQTPLHESFKAFSIHYGCVVHLRTTATGYAHTILHNVPLAEAETHRPSTAAGKAG